VLHAAPLAGLTRYMEQRMEPVTPQVVFDLYALLSNEQQIAFLKLLGRASTAEVPFMINGELTIGEQQRYAEMIGDTAIAHLMPVLAAAALTAVREFPNATNAEIEQAIVRAAEKSFQEYDDHVSEIEQAKLKSKRDRKPDPETIRRNVEICNLRKHDKKTWTHGKLAQRYKMKKQTVARILKAEAKWRQNASQIGE
jgi:hypothetical protein